MFEATICDSVPAMSRAYDADFYSWAMDQADALKRRSSNELDWDNLAEELASLGRTEARELKSRYVVLIAHLLKWIVQPDRRGPSWRATIIEQRKEIAQHLVENPGLKSRDAEIFTAAAEIALPRAAGEMGVEIGDVPADPPFTLDEAKNADWWPA